MPNLQKVFDRPEMTLSDLRLLGQQGEAILYLVDGKQAIVRPKFAVVQEKRMVNGNWQVVSERDSPFSRDLLSNSNRQAKTLSFAEKLIETEIIFLC
ncbi:hypothetical protein OQG81_03400 [Streptococcus macedonicus]|uniref:Uncharacterized protein n=1 Tax=Streptococcus macedonicus TaxID=59310 RepID=A0AA47FDH1_STRMC|nr:hypothetical protein [Streptococcus macedonicus]WAK63916.1 hypothetical protein OQG81_03400 [Streptococcus macedonicus]